MRTDFGPDRLRFAGLIPERVQKVNTIIGFQPRKNKTFLLRRGKEWRTQYPGDNCWLFDRELQLQLNINTLQQLNILSRKQTRNIAKN